MADRGRTHTRWTVLPVGLVGLLCGLAVMGGTGLAADYNGPLMSSVALDDDDIDLRTVERRPGRWYLRVVGVDMWWRCPDGREGLSLLDASDVRPREIPIRRGNVHGTFRQVELELDPFVASASFVLKGRFGRRRARGRTLRGTLTALIVGEAGTVCRQKANFIARDF